MAPESETRSGPTQGEFADPAWKPRPVAAQLVALAVRGTPILISTVAGLIVARGLPRPSGAGWVLWVACIIASSQVALILGERTARRLLPLSTMLRFSLAFPDQAPSRFGAALRSGNVGKLRRDTAKTMEIGLPLNPQEAVETALAMIEALNRHDRGTRGHSERVRAFSEMLGEELALDRTSRDKLRWGALLHDMGKLSVPSEILNKAGRPTDEEWAVLQRHPAEGERILAPLSFWLGDAVHAAGQHHERWDGTGYPRGLRGEEISLSARIVAVSDAFAVMTGARAYKKPLSMELARQELTKNAGTQFDPVVVRAMLNVSVGKMSRVAGFATPFANVPFLGSIIASAPAIPSIVSSGVAAVAITASLALPSSPLEWANPFPAVHTERPSSLALTAPDSGDTNPASDGPATDQTPPLKGTAGEKTSGKLASDAATARPGLDAPTSSSAPKTDLTARQPLLFTETSISSADRTTTTPGTTPKTPSTIHIDPSQSVTTTSIATPTETRPSRSSTTTAPDDTKPPRSTTMTAGSDTKPPRSSLVPTSSVPTSSSSTTSTTLPQQPTTSTTIDPFVKPPKQPPLATTTTPATTTPTTTTTATTTTTTTVAPDTKPPATTTTTAAPAETTPPIIPTTTAGGGKP